VDPLIVVFGLGVGILIGLTGIGGGSLMTPLLVLVIGTQPIVAVGSDIAYGALTKTLGGWRHLRSGTVDHALSIWLAVGGVPGAVGGVVVVSRVSALHGDGVLWALGGVLMATAIITLIRALFASELRERHTAPLTGTPARVGGIALGALLGFILGATSVGSGALVSLALLLIFRLTPHRVVGTSVFYAAALLWAAGIAHVIEGNVDYGLMGNILVGSLPGVVIGERLARVVPAAGLRPALGCVMFGSALGVMSKAGLDLNALEILGPPIFLGVVAYGIQRVRGASAAVATAIIPS
jgi:uncharacterized membrane protein YfcA